MNCVDSDLEEGEIPSPNVTDKKDRDLPRRYILKYS